MTAQPPADWHPDPCGRHDLRYWNGTHWTEHVSSRGLQGLDPLDQATPTGPARPDKRIERQLRQAGIAGHAGTSRASLFEQSVLVVNQKTKFIGVNTEYAVLDQHGGRVGAVTEVGRSRMKDALSVRSAASTLRRLQVVDERGAVVLTLTRPAKVLRSTLLVRTSDGSEVGQVVQKNLGVFGKVRFSLEAHGQAIGTMSADNWTAWDFSIQDLHNREIARITKTWAGWAKERFTRSDNYVVEINLPLDEAMHSLVLAASLAIDTALKETNANGSRLGVR